MLAAFWTWMGCTYAGVGGEMGGLGVEVAWKLMLYCLSSVIIWRVPSKVLTRVVLTPQGKAGPSLG